MTFHVPTLGLESAKVTNTNRTEYETRRAVILLPFASRNGKKYVSKFLMSASLVVAPTGDIAKKVDSASNESTEDQNSCY